MSDDAPRPREGPPSTKEGDAQWVRRLHDHTHEVELIISGALVFGLFQVPPALDAWFDQTSLRLVGTAWTVAFVGWYYTKLIVYTLILAFGAHLATRGYWVGLVGLDSVFPHGVDWDRMNYGPLTKEVYREKVRPLATLARGADRFASAIFSLAFLIVYLFLFSILLAGGAGLVTLGVTTVAPAWPQGLVWLVLMVGVALFPMAATAVDRLFPGKIPEDSTLGRAVRRILGGFWGATGGALFLPVQFILFTRIAKTVIWPLYTGLFVLLVILFLGGEAVRSGTFVPSPNDLFPSRPGPRSVDARYFATTREPESTAPFVQAEVVTGPYVRLELPLVARRDRERLEAACGDEPALGRSGLVRSSVADEPAGPSETDQVLGCLGGLWDVTLDGRPLEVEWDFRSEPGEGVTALVAFLPTAELEPGAHLLEIREVHVDIPGDDEESAEAAAEEDHRHRVHLIRFRS